MYASKTKAHTHSSTNNIHPQTQIQTPKQRIHAQDVRGRSYKQLYKPIR